MKITEKKRRTLHYWGWSRLSSIMSSIKRKSQIRKKKRRTLYYWGWCWPAFENFMQKKNGPFLSVFSGRKCRSKFVPKNKKNGPDFHIGGVSSAGQGRPQHEEGRDVIFREFVFASERHSESAPCVSFAPSCRRCFGFLTVSWECSWQLSLLCKKGCPSPYERSMYIKNTLQKTMFRKVQHFVHK